MKKIVDHFLFLNFWVAIGVVLLSAESFLFLSQKIQYSYLFFVFCATLFIYNFQRFFISKSDSSPEGLIYEKWIVSNHSKIILTGIIAAAGILFCIFFFTLSQLFFLLPVAITSLVYSIGDNKKLKGIREIPYLKIFIITFSWGYVTGFLPGIFSGNTISEIYPVFLMKTLFAFCVYIPFEIRDMKTDPPSFKTLPQVLGVNGSLLTGMILLLVFTWMSLMYSFLPAGIIFAVCFITLSGLLLSARKKNQLFYFLFIDSLLVLKPLFSFAALKFL